MKTHQSKPPLLVAVLSEALLSLITEDNSIVDGVEVGPWYSSGQISAARRKLPDLPFFFHGANLIAEMGENLGVENRIKEYLACSGSPWVSVHLMVWEAGEVERIMHWERLPLPDPEEALARLSGRLKALNSLVPVPVLVENIEPLPFDGYDFWSQPEYIRRVVKDSGCGLLLDIGHLRVSADHLHIPAEQYMGSLPLEQVVEVHVSGPRRRKGRLVDLHEPMLKADYDLLELLLSRHKPQAVTLEYPRDRENLLKQLNRLHKLPGMNSPSS
jgi:uncharacterized protein (UPF0276 family)